MKPAVFIGSSKESLDVARQLSRLLAPAVNCTIWDNGFFSLNDSTFDTLLTKSALYDSGIILLTKDDKSLIRGKIKITPRDNTVFEAGLFYGRLGKGRVFLVVEDGVKLPSDIVGITILYFKKGKSRHSDSIKTVADKLTNAIEDAFSRHHFGLLPSTALAVGYFHNFIKPTANEIAQDRRVRDSETGEEYPINSLLIHMPNDKTLDIRSLIATQAKQHRWRDGHVIRDGKRNFNVKYLVNKRGKARIIDIPSTLSVVGLVIDKVFSDGTIGVNENIKIAMKRELENFEHAINDLIQNDASVCQYVSIKI